MEARTVYEAVVKAETGILKAAGLKPLKVHKIIYEGGSSSLPGLDETFFVRGFPGIARHAILARDRRERWSQQIYGHFWREDARRRRSFSLRSLRKMRNC